MTATRCSVLGAVLLAGTLGCTRGEPHQGPAPASATPAPAKANPVGCNSDLSQLIQADYTLTQKCSPYRIERGLQVDGYVLTIEPGVEVQLGEGAALEVGFGRKGKLLARGTKQAPIRFVSAGRKEPGFWKSIGLYHHSDGSVLEQVVIEHAGAADKPALAVYGDDIRLSRLKFVAVKAMAIEQRDFDKAIISELAENDFTEAGPTEALLALNVNSLPALTPGNRFPPTAVIRISGRVQSDVRIPNPGVPYRVLQDLEVEGTEGVPASLTLEAGTVFQMGEGVAIHCGRDQNAAFKAVGTAERPIVFGRFGEVAKGSWKGLHFLSKCRPPTLEHVRLSDGPRDGALLNHRDSKGLGILHRCTLARSAGRGLWVTGTKERFELFDENTFAELAQAAISLPAEYAHQLGERNLFPPDSLIELTGDVRRDTTLSALSVPYLVRSGAIVESVDEAKSAVLTLQPGVTVKFDTDLRLSVAYGHSGGLVAVGTEAKPIVMTAALESWRGLALYERARATLENVVIEKVSPDYPGAEARGGQGSLKNVTFKQMKLGLRRCGAKLTVSGLKAEQVTTAESDEGC